MENELLSFVWIVVSKYFGLKIFVDGASKLLMVEILLFSLAASSSNRFINDLPNVPLFDGVCVRNNAKKMFWFIFGFKNPWKCGA